MKLITSPNIFGNILAIPLLIISQVKVKDIDVSVIPKASVIPLGNSVRIKIIYKWSFGGVVCRSRRRKTI